MRDEKFEVQGRTIDRKNKQALLAALKREPFYNHQNSMMLLNYFFMEDFLSEISQRTGGNDLAVQGGQALRGQVKPYRIPTDIDLQAARPYEIIDVIREIVEKEKDAKYSLNSLSETGNKVVKTSVDANLHGLQGRFHIDIVPFEGYSRGIVTRKTLGKIISSDKEHEMDMPSVEQAVAQKVRSIMDKLSRDNPFFRLQDFYDVFMICANNDVNMKHVADVVRGMIEQNQFVRDKSKEDVRSTRDKLGTLVMPTQAEISKYGLKTKVTSEEDVKRAVKFTKDIVQEIDF